MRYLYFWNDDLFINEKERRLDLEDRGFTYLICDDDYEPIVELDQDSDGEPMLHQKNKQEIETELGYQTKRKYDYPSIGDQLDSLYHAGIFPDDMAERIRTIKEKYPKS